MDELEQLEELQREMYKNAVEAPEELEQQIRSAADEVSAHLFYRPDQKHGIEFNDRKYVFMATKRIINFKETIFMAVVDVSEKKPRVFNVQAEVDNGFSYRENLRATVEAFLRDRSGLVNVGEIDEDE